MLALMSQQMTEASALMAQAGKKIVEMRAALHAASSAMHMAREHIEGEVDVKDGDYGEPAPNAAMNLDGELAQAIAQADLAAAYID